MRPLADLHTHSVASGHAYSTISELAATAAERGLELIAVTDHGPALPGAPHEWYFGNLKIVPAVMHGVRILKGVEANVLVGGGCDRGPDGELEALDPRSARIDLADDYLAKLDFVALGLHPTCGLDELNEAERTTALVTALANPLVDMVTHAGNPAFPVDVDAVVEAAVRHGVIVEINNASYDSSMARSGSTERERALARAAVETGALVAVSSDAHFHTRVGVFDHALAVLEEYGVAEGNVVNRDAGTVMAHLRARRERPRLDMGGVV